MKKNSFKYSFLEQPDEKFIIPHEITLEDIEKAFTDIFQERKDNNKRKVVIGQGCLTQGYVTRDEFNLNLCNNPKCASCQMFHKLIEEEIKNLPFKLEDDE